jgi:hypothetical protein
VSKKLEDEVVDWCKWFHEHKDSAARSGDLRKVAAFQSKAIDGLLGMVALIALDMRSLEHRNAIERRPTGLFLPTGVNFPQKTGTHG